MKKFWTEHEEEFLKNNIETQGCQWVADKLNRSIITTRNKARYYNLRHNKILEKYSKDVFIKTVKQSNNLIEILKYLGMTLTGANNETLKKYIIKYDIDTSHFTKNSNIINLIKRDSCDILVENSTYTSTHNLKNRLYKEGLKQRKCELCSQGETWNGKQMSLILDHINGIHNDNRLDNLRIVCPNCNATLDTHCGKNKNAEAKRIKKEKQKLKSRQSHFNRRKIKDRPPKDVLFKEVEETSYCAVGRKYGVSDNCVRKWLK